MPKSEAPSEELLEKLPMSSLAAISFLAAWSRIFHLDRGLSGPEADATWTAAQILRRSSQLELINLILENEEIINKLGLYALGNEITRHATALTRQLDNLLTLFPRSTPK